MRVLKQRAERRGRLRPDARPATTSRSATRRSSREISDDACAIARCAISGNRRTGDREIEPQLDRRQRIAHFVSDTGGHASERGQSLLTRELTPEALLFFSSMGEIFGEQRDAVGDVAEARALRGAGIGASRSVASARSDARSPAAPRFTVTIVYTVIVTRSPVASARSPTIHCHDRIDAKRPHVKTGPRVGARFDRLCGNDERARVDRRFDDDPRRVHSPLAAIAFWKRLGPCQR